jgi:translin-associated factor X-interacting protein
MFSADTSTSSRPKFLVQLESYIKEECALLGVPDDGPSEERLQVYREAFRYLIEEFRTYKPMLTSIKHEYEMLLDNYRQQLHLMQPLQARLSTLKAETARVVKRLKVQCSTAAMGNV